MNENIFLLATNFWFTNIKLQTYLKIEASTPNNRTSIYRFFNINLANIWLLKLLSFNGNLCSFNPTLRCCMVNKTLNYEYIIRLYIVL